MKFVRGNVDAPSACVRFTCSSGCGFFVGNRGPVKDTPPQGETIQMEAPNAAGHVSFHKIGSGCVVTRKIGALLAVSFVVSVVAAAALAAYFRCGREQSVFRDPGEVPLGVGDFPRPRYNGEASRPGRTQRSGRLPTSVLPDSYRIRLIPFLFGGNFTFRGEVEILVNVTQDTRNITLNANDIDVDASSAAVLRAFAGAAGGRRGPGGEAVPIEGFGSDRERQFFIIYLGERLSAGGRYLLKMNFTGVLNDKLQGFYRSSYTMGNTTRWIATTQFQATDARRAFPCFDEPGMKAKFKLFIGRPRNMSSLSNMPRMRKATPVSDLPDYVWDEYEESLPMSTYLVAFVVSDFEHMSKGRYSVWARADAIAQARYSLEFGPKCLKYFEKFFDIDFPLPKVDMIALPDFAAGAMENWGLITYRETAMLYEEGVSTRSNKQRVAAVVSHELAHQWFGNLVTPAWWSDLWLNEGFASYVEFLGIQAVEPSWKILEQFVIQETQNVFALDALHTSHPISVEVHHPDEISEIFDRISYGKGASLIRMMDHFLTGSVFAKGLTRYLKRHKYGNARQDDLWRALTEQAHEDGALSKSMSVKTIMDTWTLQTGFPVVRVVRSYGKGTAALTQERFLLHGASSNSSADISQQKTLWWIPITYTSSDALNFNSTYPAHWMQQERSITLNGLPSPEHWVIFNLLQTGFYRVNYDETNWKLLIRHLRDPSTVNDIATINRAQLVDDSLNLARAGLLDYRVALDVTQYLQHEVDYLPWKSALTAFSYLDDMLIRTAGYDRFKSYVLKLIGKLYDEIGFKDESRDPQLLTYKRLYILSWACAMGHSGCVNSSVTLFRSWMGMKEPDKTNPISPNLKSIVYCTAVRVGGEKEWDFAWERYSSSNVGSEKNLLLEALGCTRELWILSRYLERSLHGGSAIRRQDVPKVFNALSENPAGQMLIFAFMRGHWQELKDFFGASLFTVSSIVRSATKGLNRRLELDDLVQFARRSSHHLGGASRAVDQAIEKADANIWWMENHYDLIVQWLADAVS